MVRRDAAATLVVLLLCAVSVVAQLACQSVQHRASCTSARVSDEDQCNSMHCCWDAETSECFFPAVTKYKFENTSETNSSIEGKLTLSSSAPTPFGSDVADLKLKIVQQEVNRLHVKITDATAQRWEVPQHVVPMPSDDNHVPMIKDAIVIEQDPFGMRLKRPRSGEVFLTLQSDLVFKDQYIQFTLGFNSDAATYGLAESTREHQRLQVGSVYTMWNTDEWSMHFDKTLYGAHPFFLQVSKGQAFGVLLLNNNAMDITYHQDHMVFQVIGGVIDLYILNGPSPTDVLNQFTELVGAPAMPPYWSLGFHNCRWGYPDLAYVKEVVKNYSDAGIPLDTQWLDIDYMDAWKDFTFDEENYPQTETAAWVDQLHANGMRFVPIIDPGILLEEGYPAYDRGVADDVFIKDRTNESYYLGQVWPGPTYFPDWFHPKAENYWLRELQEFHQLVDYDGIWIDMNEIANFCNADGRGQICRLPTDRPCPSEEQTGCCLDCEMVDASDPYDFPPFLPNVVAGSLGGKTISASSIHYGDIREYDSHNLYGLMESIATKDAVQKIKGTRPFVLSRSTYLSSGRHTFHWTGDNGATWEDLRASINTISTLSIMGMPMTGADICGFIDDTTEELCTRWIEVGAFYPFSRNHNNFDSLPQELYRWPQVAEASRRVLKTRYQLLPYLYTLLYWAHTSGNAVFAPLWLNFWTDSNTYNITEQFMWGDGLLFSPVVHEGATDVAAYFPSGLWYNFYDSKTINAVTAGKQVSFATDILSTNIHVRGGVIIPMQESAMTTAAARTTPFSLLVAMSNSGTAIGSVVVDDGEQATIEPASGGNTTIIQYYASSGVLSSSVTANSYPGARNMKVDSVRILGDMKATGTLKKPCARIAFSNSSSEDKKFGTEFVAVHVDDAISEIILGPGLDIPLARDFKLYWLECSNDSGKGDDDDDEWWNSLSSGEKVGVTLAFAVGCIVLLGGVTFAYQDVSRRRAYEEQMRAPLLDA